MLASEGFYDAISEIGERTTYVVHAYHDRYAHSHAARTEAFHEVLGGIQERSDWNALSDEMKSAALSPLMSRACRDFELPQGATVCRNCNATLPQMESDLAALSKAQAIARIQELTAPQQKSERASPAYGGRGFGGCPRFSPKPLIPEHRLRRGSDGCVTIC